MPEERISHPSLTNPIPNPYHKEEGTEFWIAEHRKVYNDNIEIRAQLRGALSAIRTLEQELEKLRAFQREHLELKVKNLNLLQANRDLNKGIHRRLKGRDRLQRRVSDLEQHIGAISHDRGRARTNLMFKMAKIADLENQVRNLTDEVAACRMQLQVQDRVVGEALDEE